jgi:regulator of ribonuclease activity A
MPIVTCDISDAYPDEVAVCAVQFRHFGQRRAFAGPCETLRVRDHNLVLETVTRPGEGRVLVVDGGGSFAAGLMGDRLAELARANGWQGAVIFGAIRDSAVIDGMAFGVKALGTTARRSPVEQGGERSVPVGFGGVVFRPGDWVYADADAVIVSARPLLE